MREPLQTDNLHPSFSDITLREIYALVKYYFTTVFVCLLIFALPWAFFVGLDVGLQSTLPTEKYLWLSRIFSYGLLIFVLYLILSELPDILQRLGELFINLGKMLSRASRIKQVFGVIFFVAYFWVWAKHSTVAFFFFILVLTPGGFTYDRYLILLREKSMEHQKDN